MSQENMAIALTAAEAWREGDIQALLQMYDPEIEWDFTQYAGWPEEPVIRGHEAVRAFLEQWRDTFTEYEYEIERHIDAGERVVFLCAQHGRGQVSDSPVLMRWAQVATFR